MNKPIKVSPSIMCAKVWDVVPYIRAFEEAGLDSIHFDVMDGHYVKNIMLGTGLYSNIKEITGIPVDIHLMCLEPERFLDYFMPRTGDRVCFHPETTAHPYRLLQDIRARGCKVGLVLNPGTPVSLLEEYGSVLDYVLLMTVNPGFAGQTMVPDALTKIARIKHVLQSSMQHVEIYVDGNTTFENAPKMVAAGANGLVIGTSSLMKGIDGFYEKYQEYTALLKGSVE